MRVHHETIRFRTTGQGTYEATARVEEALRRSAMDSGILTVFCPHTSCSLVMMENASPEARRDLEGFLSRLVPGDERYEHSIEGADDMPAHIKMALTRTTETIPFSGGALLLGTWQGIYLWEHRSVAHERSLIVTAMGA